MWQASLQGDAVQGQVEWRPAAGPAAAARWQARLARLAVPAPGASAAAASAAGGAGGTVVPPTGAAEALARITEWPALDVQVDALSWQGRALGRLVGASTGTNMVGVLWLAQQMQAAGQQGAIVTILCDGGERYARSYHHPDWYLQQGIDTAQSDAAIAAAWAGAPLPALQAVVAPD